MPHVRRGIDHVICILQHTMSGERKVQETEILMYKVLLSLLRSTYVVAIGVAVEVTDSPYYFWGFSK